MAAMVTASVSSPSSAQDIPTAVPVPQKAPSSRRLPPPCWSHDETVALIDAYRDKWYSLRRGNLRANHWQEVADDVATRCSPAPGNPTKTSVQCRHKMEKLRKRYRSEMQRAVSIPGSSHRFSSSWVHFKRMDGMERGSNVPVSQPELALVIRDEDVDDDNEIDEDEDLYQAAMKRALPYNRSGYENGIGGGGGANANGFRIRIPGRPDAPAAVATMVGGGGGNKKYMNSGSKYERYSVGESNPASFTTSSRVLKDGYTKMGGSSGVGVAAAAAAAAAGKKRRGDPAEDIALALKTLGDGFVRMERMKMEMAREVESMRMEMEMKRTEMILESQQRIVEAFARAACTDKKTKKAKRMHPPSPE